MARVIRLALALTLLLVLTVSVATTATAGGRKVLDSTMAGLPVANAVLYGLTGGGLPWSIDEGRVQLFADGRLHVEVEGLVLTATGANPIGTGKAILTCAGAPVAETGTVPFSPTGDATIDAVISLPALCQGPAVFFTNATGRWFAVTGF
ncbi:MAG: hypothetical protein ABI620_04710 [Chloroflexota bacterium]